MKYFISILFVFIFIFNISYAQSLQWVTNMGGSDPDAGFDINIDSLKNIYTVGSFIGSADFNPGTNTNILNSFGSNDVFVSKQDSLGNLIWVKQVGGANAEVGYSIALDKSGNIYLTGYFTGQADFDPDSGIYNLNPIGGQEAFILKLDSNGNFLWVTHIGHSAGQIEVDSFENVYITGIFTGMADFDPGIGVFNLTSEGQEDGFILSLDSNGNFKWAIKFGGILLDWPQSIFVDSKSNSYVCGSFKGTSDFDPDSGVSNLTSAGMADIFIAKFDSVGNLIWAKSLGGFDNEGASFLTVDKYGNVYATGIFNGTANFDPMGSNFSLSSVGYEDMFIIKLDSIGNFIWAKQIGSTWSDAGYSIAIAPNNDLYVTGDFGNTADFDPGIGTYNITSFGYEDIFIQKLDSAGNFIFANHYGGIDGDYGYSVILDEDESFYLTGLFALTANFNTPAIYNINSNGDFDIFIAKFGSLPMGLNDLSKNNLNYLFPNPTTKDFNLHTSELVLYGDVIISDAFGKEISTVSFTNSSTINLYISGKTGVYFVTLISDKFYQVFKIIKI